MNWEEFKIKYKDYIIEVCNKKTQNETITFWNGACIAKYEWENRKNYIIKRITKPTHLVKRTSPGVDTHYGWEWPLKSKLNYGNMATNCGKK